MAVTVNMTQNPASLPALAKALTAGIELARMIQQPATRRTIFRTDNRLNSRGNPKNKIRRPKVSDSDSTRPSTGTLIRR